MSGPDGIQALPAAAPADWLLGLFYRPAPDDDAVIYKPIGEGRAQVVAHPTYGARRILFTGTEGEAWARWLGLAGAAA